MAWLESQQSNHCNLLLSQRLGFSVRYVAVAAFTIWKDTFDHGWIMPFLTAGVWGKKSSVCWSNLSCDLTHLGRARYVCMGWRACGVAYAYDFPYATMDLAHDFLSWNLLCRDDARTSFQHFLKLSWNLLRLLCLLILLLVLLFVLTSDRKKTCCFVMLSAIPHVCAFGSMFLGFLGIQLAINSGWNWLSGIGVCWAGDLEVMH